MVSLNMAFSEELSYGGNIDLILMDYKDSDMQKDRKNFQIEKSRVKTLKWERVRILDNIGLCD